MGKAMIEKGDILRQKNREFVYMGNINGKRTLANRSTWKLAYAPSKVSQTELAKLKTGKKDMETVQKVSQRYNFGNEESKKLHIGQDFYAVDGKRFTLLKRNRVNLKVADMDGNTYYMKPYAVKKAIKEKAPPLKQPKDIDDIINGKA